MPETKGNDTPQQTSPLGALDFKRIIGAPLSACVSAQEEAAQATLEYINEVVFRRKDDDPDNLEPVTVTFYFESAGVVNRLTIPLLCIVPVPYLQIEQVNLTFQATVTESSMSDDRLQLKAKYSSPGDSGEESDVSKAEYQNRRCIDVNLCVTAADMPMGISKILEIFNNQLVEVRQEEPSLLPKPAPQPEPEPSPQPESQPALQPQPAPQEEPEAEEVPAKYNVLLLTRVSKSQKSVIINVVNTHCRRSKRLSASALNNILKGSQLTIPIEETYTVAKAIVDGLKKRNIAASVVEV